MHENSDYVLKRDISYISKFRSLMRKTLISIHVLLQGKRSSLFMMSEISCKNIIDYFTLA